MAYHEGVWRPKATGPTAWFDTGAHCSLDTVREVIFHCGVRRFLVSTVGAVEYARAIGQHPAPQIVGY